jgi:hypothetical protein
MFRQPQARGRGFDSFQGGQAVRSTVLAPTNRAQIFRRLFSFSRLGKEFVNLAIEDAGVFSSESIPMLICFRSI